MPSADHLLYIPVMLLAGVIVGFYWGARATRRELERRDAEKRE